MAQEFEVVVIEQCGCRALSVNAENTAVAWAIANSDVYEDIREEFGHLKDNHVLPIVRGEVEINEGAVELLECECLVE